jgi:hypothetical protein
MTREMLQIQVRCASGEHGDELTAWGGQLGQAPLAGGPQHRHLEHRGGDSQFAQLPTRSI